MIDRLVGSSIPVFRIDGEVIGELARDLTRLTVEEDTAGLKTFAARFLARGPYAGSDEERLLYLDGRVFDFGKRISVSIGPSGGERTVFEGAVSAIEVDHAEGMPADVVISAEDELMDFRMTRKTKTYADASDADVANEIASRHGLSADVDADGPSYDVVQQWNASDLAFLRERGHLIGAETWVLDRTLHFRSRDKRQATAVTLVQGNELIAARIRADLAHQRTSVRVSGYDAAARKSIDEEAGEEAVRAEVASGLIGPAVLRRAFGDRETQRVRDVPLTAEEARDRSRTEMLRRGRTFVTAIGTTSGTPDLAVGSLVTLDRVGAPFEGGGYVVTSVAHTYDLNEGHRTRFEAERPWINELR